MIALTDIFAGAGGSSTGAAQVPGVVVTLAANHWKLAVDVHQENHQDTEHACVDLHLEDPRNFPKTDILWASPECTKWSIANSKAKALSVEMGGDPTLFDHIPVELESTEDDEITRSRLLMFDVLRFIEYHRYRIVVVENVLDIATRAMYRAAWELWRKNLRRLGYHFRVISLNSMHAQYAGDPAPQSRDRLYIVAWPETERPPDLERALRPAAWCPRCEQAVQARQAWKPGRSVGRYRAQYVYACPHCGTAVEPGWLPASTAIDWSLPAERIGDRARPLSDKTMARIREGLRRYGSGHGPLVMRNNTGGAEMTTPAYEPLRTLTTTGHQSALLPRGVFLTQFRDRIRNRDPFAEPLPTQVADGANHGLVIEAAGNTYDAADPRHPRHGQEGGYVRAWPTSDPLRTLHASPSKALLIPVEGRDGKTAAPAEQPMRTQTTRNETGVLVPSGGTWHEHPYPTSGPLRTVTTRENHGLLMPTETHALITLRGTNAPKPVTAPLDTVAASGNHHGLLDITEDDVMAARFRMLEPAEIANGMAFPRDYKWQGTKRERVRMAGNAVTPPAARDLLTAIVQDVWGVAA